MHNKSIFQIAATVSIISSFAFGAMPVFAQTPTGVRAVATPGAKAQERQASVLERLKTKADKEIDRRVTGLTHLIDVINKIKRISTDQKTSLVAQVQEQITSLNALKTKIDADTDIATLRTDVQSIVKSYRIFALFIPKTYVIAHADRLLDVADEMTQISVVLQARIDEAKTAGKDTASMQTLMTDRTSKLADAKTQAQNAINAVLPLTPDGYPANKTTLQSARTMLQTARKDLQAAHKDAQDIRRLLGAAGVKTNAKLTPTTTPTPAVTPTP